MSILQEMKWFVAIVFAVQVSVWMGQPLKIIDKTSCEKQCCVPDKAPRSHCPTPKTCELCLRTCCFVVPAVVKIDATEIVMTLEIMDVPFAQDGSVSDIWRPPNAV